MYRLFFLYTFWSISTLAQTNNPITVATGLPNGIFNIAFHNSNIYFTKAFNGNNFIGKVDLIASSTTYQILISNINQPYGLAINNNFLYYSEYGPQKIARLDLNLQNSYSEQLPILFEQDGPYGLRIYNNQLYYSEGIMNIKSVPLSNPEQTPNLLVTYTLHPYDFIKVGDYIYATEEGAGNDRIIKMNLLETFPPEPIQVASIYRPLSLAKIDNYLFVLSNENSIYKIDLNQNNPVPSLFYSTIQTGGLIEHIREYNNELYFTLNEETNGGSIKKFAYNQLGNAENIPNNAMSVYPNPATNSITLTQNVELKTLKIFDMTGKLIIDTTSNKDTIDISMLRKGFYFIEAIDIEGVKTVTKFIKK